MIFIAIEGIDGAGTTTQTQRLRNWIITNTKHFAYQTSEPSSGQIGQFIRKLLKGEVKYPPEVMIPLFVAERANHRLQLEKYLSSGKDKKIVISDRYTMSTMAYQCTSLIDGTERRPEYIKALLAACPLPDLTVFIDVDLETAKARRTQRKKSKEWYEEAEIQAQVHRNYKKLYEQRLDLVWEVNQNIVRIDGNGTPDEVEASARTAVNDTLQLW